MSELQIKTDVPLPLFDMSVDAQIQQQKQLMLEAGHEPGMAFMAFIGIRNDLGVLRVTSTVVEL